MALSYPKWTIGRLLSVLLQNITPIPGVSLDILFHQIGSQLHLDEVNAFLRRHGMPLSPRSEERRVGKECL